MIDKKTKNLILKKTKITDVISKYMRLHARDNNFVGYCPFHPGKMMSLIIDTANNTYHCTECGKRGSAIDFLIDILHINYDEALCMMAKISGIDAATESNKSEAQTLYEINAEACQYYQQQLKDSDAGKNIALPYYKQQRGFSDEIISDFHLGYSPARPNNHLIEHLLSKGYSEESIIASGIGVRFDEHQSYDRFHERITFPIFNLTGNIVGFSCRTMKRDDNIAKYKNTNDTPIYTKGNEIYGLFQARQHILECGKCILVEGNADVVSMHKAGFKYTVAPLGTGFTYSQACVLRRFTDDITLLFDGDGAGLHANEVALQHLLPLGITPHIVLLPQGDDPDSFSRRLSHDEAEQYISDNSIDPVQFYFKTRLGEKLDNPILTAQVAREIIQKLAMIPNNIVRSGLVKECHHLLDIDEDSLLRDVQSEMKRIKDEEYRRKQQALARAQYMSDVNQQATNPASNESPKGPESNASENEDSDIIGSSLLTASAAISASVEVKKSILATERIIMHYVAKYGMVQFSAVLDEEGKTHHINITEYIAQEFDAFGLVFHDPMMKRIFNIANNIVPDFYSDFSDFEEHLQAIEEEKFKKGIEIIGEKNLDVDSIRNEEDNLKKRIQKESFDASIEFQQRYFESYLCFHPDKEIRLCGLKLVNEPFKLSKIYTQQASVASEYDNLNNLIPNAIYNLRFDILTQKINTVKTQLKNETNEENIMQLMTTQMELQQQRRKLSEKCLGTRVFTP